MKSCKKLTVIMIAVLVSLIAAQTAFAEAAHMRRIRMAADLINEMSAEKDAESLADVIKSGKGVAIFPAVTKAGFVVGGQTGEGVVFLKKANGKWTGPAFMGINGASIGFQVGVQSIGLVLVITNENGLRAFTGDNSFKLGADVSVAAGPAGRDAAAATDGRLAASIYSYSMAKGIFAGISVDGSVINQNRDASQAYWGKALSPKASLSKPANDKRVANLIKALNNLQKKAPK